MKTPYRMLRKIELYCILQNIKDYEDVPDCDNCGEHRMGNKCSIGRFFYSSNLNYRKFILGASEKICFYGM